MNEAASGVPLPAAAKGCRFRILLSRAYFISLRISFRCVFHSTVYFFSLRISFHCVFLFTAHFFLLRMPFGGSFACKTDRQSLFHRKTGGFSAYPLQSHLGKQGGPRFHVCKNRRIRKRIPPCVLFSISPPVLQGLASNVPLQMHLSKFRHDPYMDLTLI